MSHRKNFTMDDEADELLEEHSDDNHSEIVRELIKAYYTTGVYDVEEAAIRVRERELRRQESQLEEELQEIREEREQIEELAEDTGESDIESVAEELPLNDPDLATPDNPAIRKKAKQNGIEPSVLAEVVRENALEKQVSGLQSIDG